MLCLYSVLLVSTVRVLCLLYCCTVLGCARLSLSSDVHARPVHGTDDVIVACNRSLDTWYLSCRDNRWIGHYDNISCSAVIGHGHRHAADPAPPATCTYTVKSMPTRCWRIMRSSTQLLRQLKCNVYITQRTPAPGAPELTWNGGCKICVIFWMFLTSGKLTFSAEN